MKISVLGAPRERHLTILTFIIHIKLFMIKEMLVVFTMFVRKSRATTLFMFSLVQIKSSRRQGLLLNIPSTKCTTTLGINAKKFTLTIERNFRLIIVLTYGRPFVLFSVTSLCHINIVYGSLRNFEWNSKNWTLKCKHGRFTVPRLRQYDTQHYDI